MAMARLARLPGAVHKGKLKLDKACLASDWLALENLIDDDPRVRERNARLVGAQSPVLGDREPYLRHLRDLHRAGHETIYLVGGVASENRAFMEAIADQFARETGWTIVDRRQ